MSSEQIYLNDEKWYECINSLKKIANDILREQTGFNQSSIEIVYILNKLPTSISDYPAFLVFQALSSETTLPLVHARKYWNSVALIKADQELKQIEARYADAIPEACQHLLEFNFDNFRFK
ncbi:MAG: DUF2489 domain-containing protein [Gammaproteobacteria bacterium]|nr:DUF2489 domain-containing protein [Gammaproteobacteria bacterium]